jgi:o-succinylbenzoate synthase
MMKAYFKPYTLDFINPSGTSRGVLRQKKTYFIFIEDKDKRGIGEAALFEGLSYDDQPDYEKQLQWTCENIDLGKEKLLLENKEFPSIQFGLETAFLSFEAYTPFEIFPSAFTNGEDSIKINGLIWMGEKAFMKAQIKDKIQQGFSCVKMKIGAINFEEELALLKFIRQEFSADDIELRVDANGAFSPEKALEKLKRLSDFDLHSIEQPIKQGQWQEMAELCESTPLPIALDEELIGFTDVTKRKELLLTIQPQYVILKPALVGGLSESKNWIDLAEEQHIGSWITSALESNIGLNAIAQYTYTLNPNMPQGLGTGSLFSNNFESPLKVDGERLKYDPNKSWSSINGIL